MLQPCVHLAGIAHRGVAQVLNVLSLGDGIAASEGVVGLIAAEWTPGADLVDLAAGRCRSTRSAGCSIRSPPPWNNRIIELSCSASATPDGSGARLRPAFD
jgi:hypothetical protein